MQLWRGVHGCIVMDRAGVGQGVGPAGRRRSGGHACAVVPGGGGEGRGRAVGACEGLQAPRPGLWRWRGILPRAALRSGRVYSQTPRRGWPADGRPRLEKKRGQACSVENRRSGRGAGREERIEDEDIVGEDFEHEGPALRSVGAGIHGRALPPLDHTEAGRAHVSCYRTSTRPPMRVFYGAFLTPFSLPLLVLLWFGAGFASGQAGGTRGPLTCPR